MPFDGVFIHFLVQELKDNLVGKRINKIVQPNMLDIVFQFKANSVQKQLLISSSLDMPRIYFTDEKVTSLDIPKNFCVMLRKYIERGIIKDIFQVGNDRVIIFKIESYSELGDLLNYQLSFELMGRNSNLMLIDNNNCIIDAIRKIPPSVESNRLIIPHAPYVYPTRDDAINPFSVTDSEEIDFSKLEGCSKLMLNECGNASELTKYLNTPIKPYIFEYDNKHDFYVLPLSNKKILRDDFNNISSMLDTFYKEYRLVYNDKAKVLKRIVKNKLVHLNTKLGHLEDDLKKANENLNCNHLGLLLQANLYRVNKGDTSIIVNDYTSSNDEIEIELDPTLDPSKNLKRLFTKGKKAKNAIEQTSIQIDITKNEISYLDTILVQLEFANSNELDEITDELIKERYLKPKKATNSKRKNTTISKYNIDGIDVYVGKNNIQNSYITHQLSSSFDWWFHVKDMPGSHVLFKSPYPGYELSEKEIRFCANLAGSFSKASHSSSVPVVYTLIKYIKKIPGLKGCEVTYTNQKTIYIDPKL